MKRFLVMTMMVTMMAGSTTNVYAIDRRVTSSRAVATHKVITKKEAKTSKYWKKGYLKGKASGHITAKQFHYANIYLYTNNTNHAKSSGRKWGKKKVSVSTGWDKGISCFLDMYFPNIFFGFKK